MFNVRDQSEMHVYNYILVTSSLTDQSVLCVHNYMYTINTPVIFDLSDQSEVFVHNNILLLVMFYLGD